MRTMLTQFRRGLQSERGNVSLLMVLTMFILFAMLAMVWNTGAVTSERARMQIAADTAAHAAAVRVSRLNNLITATNMMVVVNLSEYGHALATPITAGKIVKHWSDKIKSLKAIPIVGPALAAAMAAYIVVAEFLPTAPDFWFGALIPAIIEIVQFGGGPALSRISEIVEFQESMIDGTAVAIEGTRAQMAEYYNCDIRLTQPGQVGLSKDTWEPPVHQAGPTALLIPVMQQWNKDYKGMYDYLKPINIGKGQKEWKNTTTGTVAGSPFVAWIFADMPYIIRTQPAWSPIDMNPDEDEIDQYFTVVATAKRESGATPRHVFQNIFGKGLNANDIVLCYAEAETYNPAAGAVDSVPGLGPILNMIPWRGHTTLGMQWQARLTRQTALREALENDPTMQLWWLQAGILPQDYSVLDDGSGKAALH